MALSDEDVKEILRLIDESDLDELLIETVGEGEIRLRTPEQAIRVAQAIVARHVPKNRDLVAELIAERRKEAERE